MASPPVPVVPGVRDTGEPSLVKLVTKLEVACCGISLLITLTSFRVPLASVQVVLIATRVLHWEKQVAAHNLPPDPFRCAE